MHQVPLLYGQIADVACAHCEHLWCVQKVSVNNKIKCHLIWHMGGNVIEQDG